MLIGCAQGERTTGVHSIRQDGVERVWYLRCTRLMSIVGDCPRVRDLSHFLAQLLHRGVMLRHHASSSHRSVYLCIALVAPGRCEVWFALLQAEAGAGEIDLECLPARVLVYPVCDDEQQEHQAARDCCFPPFDHVLRDVSDHEQQPHIRDHRELKHTTRRGQPEHLA